MEGSIIYVFPFLIFTVAMWLWNRTEGRTDSRYLNAKIDTYKQDLDDNVKLLYKEIDQLHRCCKYCDRSCQD